MKKPLRKRIADAIKVLKGEHLPMDVPIPKLEISDREIKTIVSRYIYPHICFDENTTREVLRKKAEERLTYEIARYMMLEGAIQFCEDDCELVLNAIVRVVMPEVETNEN